jgi:hypothetical protein
MKNPPSAVSLVIAFIGPAAMPDTIATAHADPVGAAIGRPCSAHEAAKLTYDPNTGKEIVCVNQALTPTKPPTWEWSQPPPMTTGVNATGTSCNPQLVTMSRSTDGYLIVCAAYGRGDPNAGYWEHFLGPLE